MWFGAPSAIIRIVWNLVSAHTELECSIIATCEWLLEDKAAGGGVSHNALPYSNAFQGILIVGCSEHWSGDAKRAKGNPGNPTHFYDGYCR